MARLVPPAWENALHRFRQFLGPALVGRKRVLFLLLMGIGLVWAFAEILDEVREGETRSFDEAVLETVSLHQAPPWLWEAVRDITALGSVSVLFLCVTAAVGHLVLRNRIRVALLVVVSTLSGTGVSTLLKHWVERARPIPLGETARVFSPSFPSGHSMMSAVVFVTLGVLLAEAAERKREKGYILGVALFLTFLVGASRVLLGVHYPTDVLAGWCLGLTWGILAALLVRRV